MSDVARHPRSPRQTWAAPGSPHDRWVGLLRVALPMAIGVLAAFLVLAPVMMHGESSFVLSKNRVDVASERLKIQSATYRGEDGKGQPFALHANSAIQKSSSEPVVKLQGLAGELRLPDGPATIRADHGRYDMDSQKMALDGPITFRGPNNYTLDTQDATVDLKNRTMRSGGQGVTGTVPQGRFSANRMSADLADRTVTLDGRARLRIVPGRTK